MKNQTLFSSKDKGKKLKCLLQFLFGALMVNMKFRTKSVTFCLSYDSMQVANKRKHFE